MSSSFVRTAATIGVAALLAGTTASAQTPKPDTKPSVAVGSMDTVLGFPGE